ncbi:hypothetical protein M0D21_22485 [Aquimarina sp. D1M17]|uniref:RNA polymerase sigma factor n=1 Tax=Aquimarina acroporae TaxID=2937283 RepID=UPI0020BD5494|nr:hypothetical protein [Aquimarina acroporae]MCK8524363.1 hypothetical protein [Aquimarina acroporae]
MDKLQHIIECAQEGNQLPFNDFFKRTFQKLKPKLLSVTRSEDDTQEVFIIALQKFWERFVINQEDLPHNSVGYIYMMCKNAWLMQRRKKVVSTVSFDNSSIRNSSLKEEIEWRTNEDREANERDELLQYKALSQALKALSPKCQTLMENELENDTSLKELQLQLGFTNYQALVQAKYNCKKRLVRMVYLILEELKSQKIS